MRNQGISRRQLIKSGLGAAAALSGLEMIVGCATMGTPKSEDISASLAAIKPEPVVYPPLPDKKIQPPENGCLIGLRRMYVDYDKNGLGTFIKLLQSSNDFEEYEKKLEPKKWKELFKLEEAVKNYANYYMGQLEQNPAILVFQDTPKLFRGFPTTEVSIASSMGMIPYINAAPFHYFKPSIGLLLNDIAKGKHDPYLKNLAEGAVKFGEKHGGFFFTTMEEPNGYWYYWGQNSNFIPAWQHIWQIFEDQGANQYATWVWEGFCLEPTVRLDIAKMQPPERYYPGDKYVDWIGFSAFSRKGLHGDGMLFEYLINKSYGEIRKIHPDKPIMQAEFGKTNMYDQSQWLAKAYTSIKRDFPAMKAAIYWDNITTPGSGDDHTLNEKSLPAMKEIFKDPYWIMAK